MTDRLDGCVAVVTGGGSGVGRATVAALVATGATVVAAGRRGPVCKAVARAARDAGGRAYGASVDVAAWESAQALVAETMRVAGPPLRETIRRMHEKGRMRPAEQPAALIGWLVTPWAADLCGQVADIDDEQLRSRVGTDLGMPPF